MTDAVNHPQHYNHGKYEVINILEDQLSEMPLDAFGGFCLAECSRKPRDFNHGI